MLTFITIADIVSIMKREYKHNIIHMDENSYPIIAKVREVMVKEGRNSIANTVNKLLEEAIEAREALDGSRQGKEAHLTSE